MCKGHEYIHGLGQYLVPLVFRHEADGTAVMKPVGHLDQYHAHIVVEREQNAFEVLCLKALGRNAFAVLVVQDCFDLGKSVHKAGYFWAEEVGDVLYSV